MTPRVLVIAAISALAGCSAHAGPPERFQGVVEYDERRLGLPLGGVITTLPVVEGHGVARGDVLATLDDQLERTQRDSRVAAVAAAEARLALLEAGTRAETITQVRARLAGAQAAERSAQLRLSDDKRLSQVGATPASVLIDREAALAEAQAARRALEEELRALRHGARPEEIAAARAEVTAARASVAASDTRLAQHRLAAPTAGTVLDVHVRAGEVVSPGMPVVTIADTTHPFIDVFVPESRISEIAVGDQVQVSVDTLPLPVTGTVEHIARRTEFTPSYVFSDKERPHLVIRVRVRAAPPPGVALPAGVPAFVAVTGRP